MALAFVALADSALLDTSTARTWLVVAVIAVTATWLVAQIWLSTRLRIPAYDLPPAGTPEGRTGGER
jgi:ATP synthase protein I